MLEKASQKPPNLLPLPYGIQQPGRTRHSNRPGLAGSVRLNSISRLMQPEPEETVRKQGPRGLRTAFSLVILVSLLAIAAALFWPNLSSRRAARRDATAVAGFGPSDRSSTNRRPGQRTRDEPVPWAPTPIYQGTNFADWTADLQSTNPAKVQRARAALATLGVELPPTFTPAAEKSNPASVPSEASPAPRSSERR